MIMTDANDKRNQSGGMFGRVTDEFSVRSATSGVGWDVQDVQPFFPCYIGVDDQILIQTANSTGNSPCAISLRILGLDGLIHPIQFFTTAGGGRSFTTIRQQLMEGWLLSCNVNPTVLMQAGSWIYATVSIERAPFGATNQYEVLVAGYLDNNVGLSYPMSQLQRPIDGNGAIISEVQGNPAAGADVVVTVPSGARWRFVSFRGTLTTAVAAGNRLVSLVIDDGVNLFAESPSNFTQGPSIVNTYNWFDSAQYLAAPFNLRTLAPSPSLCYLHRSFRISTQTTGIQAADQWSSVVLLVQEWFEND